MQDKPKPGAFDIDEFVAGLANDLSSLRSGHISTNEARTRTQLAREILRAIGYQIIAGKYLYVHAQEIRPVTFVDDDHD